MAHGHTGTGTGTGIKNKNKNNRKAFTEEHFFFVDENRQRKIQSIFWSVVVIPLTESVCAHCMLGYTKFHNSMFHVPCFVICEMKRND